MGLVPFDGGGDADDVAVGVEGDVLDEVRLAPGAGDADGLAEGAVVGDGDGVDVVDGGHGAVERAGIDVPGVVLLGACRRRSGAGCRRRCGARYSVLAGRVVMLVMQPFSLSMTSLRRALARVKVEASESRLRSVARLRGWLGAVGVENGVAEGGDVVDVGEHFEVVGAGDVVGDLRGDEVALGVGEGDDVGGFGELDVERDGFAARPGHGVVDDDGDAGLRRGVDAVVEGFEGGFVDVVVVVEDLVEVVLGVAVDDGDAGAGGEVVELVEGDLLPVGVELLVGIGVAVKPGERG